MSKIGNTYVQVLADMTKFTSEVKAKTSKTALPDAKIKVEADTSDLNRAGSDARKAGRDFDVLGSKVTKLNQGMSLAGKSIGLLKIPAMISAIGPAIQGIDALAAGAVALSGSLTSAAGAAAAMPSVYGALGQAMLVVKLSGVDKLKSALGGLNEEMDKSAKAYKALSPEAKKFAGVLNTLKKPVQELQESVQKPLFQGMGQGIKEASHNLPVFQKVLTGTSHVLGGLAIQAGELFGSKGFGRDFAKIGDTNNKVLENLGSTGLNFASALRHVMVAARPLTEWLGDSIEQFSEWVEKSAEAGRRSGDLAEFFDDTKDTLKIVVPMMGDLFKGLWNVLQLGRGTGNTLFSELGDASEQFRKWTESASGENAIVKWFHDSLPPLREAGRLLHDIGAAFFSIGDANNKSGLTSILHTLRTEVLPVLVEIIQGSEGLGPIFAKFATELLTALRPVVGANGVLTQMLQAATKILEAFNLLIEKAPILGTVLTNALTLRASASLLGLTGGAGLFGILGGSKGKAGATGIGSKLGKWLGLGLTGAATSTVAGGGAGGAGKAGALGGLLGSLGAIKWARVGAIGVGIAVGSTIIDAMDKSVREGSDDIGEALTAMTEDVKLGPVHLDVNSLGFDANTLQAESLEGLYEGMLEDRIHLSKIQERDLEFQAKEVDLSKEAAKIRTRIFQLTKIGRKLGVGVDLSMDPKKLQQISANFGLMQKGIFTSTQQINRVVGRTSKLINDQLGKGSKDARKAMSQNFKAAAVNIAQNMQKSGHYTKAGMDRIRDLIKKSNLVNATKKQAKGFADAWADGMKKAKDYTGDHIKGIFKLLNQMPPVARRAAAETWLAQLKEASKGHPALEAKFSHLRAKALEEFGHLNLGGREQAKALYKGVGGFLGNLQKDVLEILGITQKKGVASTKRFKEGAVGNFQNMTIGALGALGKLGEETNKTLSSLKVKSSVYIAKSGAKGEEPVKAQKGAIVPGTGSGDKVPLHIDGRLAALVEPGELVSVANRTATSALMAANSRIKRKAHGGVIEQALGPYTIPPIQYDPGHAGSNSHVHLDFFTPQEAIAYGEKLQSMGWSIGEYTPKAGNPGNFGPITTQHESPGHYDGTAFDANTAQDETHAQVAAVAALVGGSGAVPGSVTQKLARMILGGPAGPLKDLGQATMDKTWKALNAFIASKAPSSVGGGVNALPGPPISGLPKNLASWNKQYPYDSPATMPNSAIQGLASWQNLPSWFWKLTIGESSGQPGAVGHDPGGTTGYGLYQETDPYADAALRAVGAGHDYNKMLNPVLNTMAARYTYATAPSQVPGTEGFPWYGISGLKDGGVLGKGKNEKASIPKLIKGLTSPKKKARKAAVHGLLARVASVGLGGSGIFDKMVELSQEWAIDDEYAGNASSRNKEMPWNLLYDRKSPLPWQIGDPTQGKFNPTTGNTDELMVSAFKTEAEARAKLVELQSGTLGLFRGQTEGGWLGADGDGELQSLFRLRGSLINADEQVQNRQKVLADMLTKATEAFRAVEKKIKELDRKIREETHNFEKTNKEIETERQKKSPNKDRIKSLIDKTKEQRTHIDKWQAHREAIRPRRDSLRDKVIPAMVSQQGELISLRGEILGSGGEGFDGLETVQGRVFDKSTPPATELSGQIFSVKQRLEGLGFPDITVTDKSPLGDTGPAGINIGQLLEFSQALKAGAFKNQNFAGFFATGGTIPTGMFGVAGETGLPEIIEGPAKVYAPGDGPAGSPTVIQVIVEDEAVDASKIRVEAGKEFDVKIRHRDRAERSAYLAGAN